jgi:hypothetical protein
VLGEVLQEAQRIDDQRQEALAARVAEAVGKLLSG